MSQTPPNSGWQGGPQGPGQQWNAGQPQGQPGHQPQGGPGQGFGRPQNSGPQGNNFGQQPQGGPGQQAQNFGQQSQNFGQNGPQGQYNQNGPQGQYNQNGPQGQFNQGQNYGPQNFAGDAPAKPKSKTKVIVAAVLGVAIIAAGIGLAMFFFRGATPAAAKGLPADVSFAAELNLAPANADKLALKNILDKYPSLKADEDFGNDYKKALYSTLTQNEEDAPDYDTEIKPWLGDSIAVGSTGTTEEELSDEANMIMAIETTDKGKAEEFAKKEMDGAKVQFIDNLMIVTDEASSLSADSIKEASLADSEQYKADMAKLGDDSLASVWFSSGMIDASLQQIEEQGIDTGTMDTSTMQGMHGAAGVKVKDNKLSVEIQVQTPNAPDMKDAADTSGVAKNISGDSLVAFSGSVGGDINQAWDMLESQPDMVESLKQFGIETPDDLKALLGKQMTMSLDWDEDSQMPVIGATFETENAEKQKQILDKFNEMLAQGSGMEGLEITQDGNTGIVAFGQSASDVLNPGSKLGDLDGFKQVVDGKAQSILFVNVAGLKERSFFQDMIQSGDTTVSEVLDPINAIGMTANAVDDHYTEAFIHVTFD